ncbi:MAG: hypothetical protein V8T87_15120 [Victivallales bacterium]
MARGAPIFNPVEQMADQPVVLNLLLGCVLAPAAEELLFLIFSSIAQRNP